MRKFLIFLVLVGLIAFGIAWYIDVSQRSHAVDIKLADVTTTPTTSVVNVLGVNMNDQPLFSQQTVENGDTALLVIYKNKMGETLNLEFIKSLRQFFSLDSNRDGMIDQTDPAYAELALLTISGSQRLTPLPQAGITAFQLDQNIAAKVNADQPIDPGQLIARALTPGAQVYPVKTVTIDKTRLNQLLNP